VRNSAVGRGDAVRNAGRRVDGLGSEGMQGVTASHVGRGVNGMDAAAAKTTAAMEATAVKSAGVKTAAAVKTTAVSASTMSATAVAAATSSLGNVRERQSQNGGQHCTDKNPGARQRDAFAVPSSQHVCLHRNRRQLGGPAAPWATRKNALAGH
jgi:hypothetical protein